MKRVLILGGDGMLGHQMLKSLTPKYDVRVTLRRPLADYAQYQLFNEKNSFAEVEASDVDRLQKVVQNFRPNIIVNAIGIVKQRAASHDAIPSLEINSLLPHRLALMARDVGARLFHFSTDCVFSGSRGNYSETDFPDADDLYGRTKLLGEVTDEGCLTIRSSIIGLELSRNKSLIEWFLAQRGATNGFTRAIYSGLTTLEMARLVEMLIEKFPDLSGLWHVSAEPISKFDLLEKFNSYLKNSDRQIKRSEDFFKDRSLNGHRFYEQTRYKAPSWDDMLKELADQANARQ